MTKSTNISEGGARYFGKRQSQKYHQQNCNREKYCRQNGNRDGS